MACFTSLTIFWMRRISWHCNSLVPGRFDSAFKSIIFKIIIVVGWTLAVKLLSCNDLVSSGNNPLTEPMLTLIFATKMKSLGHNDQHRSKCEKVLWHDLYNKTIAWLRVYLLCSSIVDFTLFININLGKIMAMMVNELLSRPCQIKHTVANNVAVTMMIHSSPKVMAIFSLE